MTEVLMVSQQELLVTITSPSQETIMTIDRYQLLVENDIAHHDQQRYVLIVRATECEQVLNT